MMDENREQLPEIESGEPIEQVQEPAQESVKEQQPVQEAEPVQEADSVQEPIQEQELAQEPPKAENAPKAQKPKRYIGLWIYALLATAACAVCLGLLLGVTGLAVVQYVALVGGNDQTIELDALESVRNYTVVISAKGADGVSTGTGFVVTEDGYIVTNYHVIENTQTITVKFYNGNAAVAEVVGYSEIDDIAVIKVQASGLYCAKIGSSARVKDAQNVYAVGTPAGEEYAWSVTKGVVSFAHREVKIYDDEGILKKKMQLIQTDTPVNPGNSGGPLVNSDGEVLGIVTLKLAGQYENMGFAIPIDGAMVIINNIIQTGEPGESPITSKRPLMGIVGVAVQEGVYYADLGDSISPEPEDLQKYPDKVFYAPYTGILVKETTPGLDAANKLQEGDIIVMANGKEIITMYDLMDVINQHNGGDTIEITYYRNGVANIVDITLGYAD